MSDIRHLNSFGTPSGLPTGLQEAEAKPFLGIAIAVARVAAAIFEIAGAICIFAVTLGSKHNIAMKLLDDAGYQIYRAVKNVIPGVGRSLFEKDKQRAKLMIRYVAVTDKLHLLDAKQRVRLESAILEKKTALREEYKQACLVYDSTHGSAAHESAVRVRLREFERDAGIELISEEAIIAMNLLLALPCEERSKDWIKEVAKCIVDIESLFLVAKVDIINKLNEPVAKETPPAVKKEKGPYDE